MSLLKCDENIMDANHENKRQTFYQSIPSFWHDLFGEPYALYDLKEMTKSEVEEIKTATKRIASIYDKTAELLRKLDDETLHRLGIPEAAVPFVRGKALPVEGVIRRVDLVRTKDGWKHYEINADTPTFIYELHHVNGKAAEHFGYCDVNEGCEELLAKTIRKAILFSHQTKTAPKVVFTAHDDHEEDWNTLLYLSKLSRIPNEMVPLRELVVREGEGVYTANGEKIDVLYRQTYPIEHLVCDKSEDGTDIGIALLNLVKEGKLALINPLSAFLLQSKAVQALIWGLHEAGHFYFTEEEHNWINQYFIPTYLEKDVFLKRNVSFVEKPSFGREGDTITIYDGAGRTRTKNALKTYDDSLKVYQEYVELPKEKVMTPYGMTEAHFLIGSFVIGKEAGAIGIRVGEKITGNESCFLPIGIKK